MAKISRMTVGQVLYKVTREQAGNTNMTRERLREYRVLEIAEDGTRVFARSDYLEPRWYRQRDADKWRVSKPEVKS